MQHRLSFIEKNDKKHRHFKYISKDFQKKMYKHQLSDLGGQAREEVFID